MKRLIIYCLLLMIGVGAGVMGSTLATKFLYPDMQIKLEEGVQKQKTDWKSEEKDGIVVGPIIMPVSDPDGRFMGYIQVRARLIGPKPRLGSMQSRLPEVLDIVNRNAWKTPIGISRDSRAVDVYEIKLLLFRAAETIYGDDALDLSVTSVVPA